MATAFPMKLSWKLAVALVLALGLVAASLALLELVGALAPGAVLRGASDVERSVALAVGLALQPFGALVLRHGVLRIDARTLRYLNALPWPRPCELALDDVARWGHAVVSNRGRRERQLLFERRNAELVLIKLAMYSDELRVLELLEQRLGPASPTVARFSGARFS